jgi:hypothetical protein
MRVQVDGIFALPIVVEGQALRQMRVQAGGSVLHLREQAEEVREVGADVEEIQPLEFARQSVVSFADGDTGSGAYLYFAKELDAPPGSYRMVLVVQDRLARTVAAQVAEFDVPEERGALGRVHVLAEDPLAVPFGRAEEGPAAPQRSSRLSTATPALPEQAIVRSTMSMVAGRPASLLYGMCDGHSRPGTKPFEGWKLGRALACDGTGEPVPLEGGRLPAAGWEDQCLLLVNPLPAGWLQPGPCRFEATLERPGQETEVRSLEWNLTP